MVLESNTGLITPRTSQTVLMSSDGEIRCESVTRMSATLDDGLNPSKKSVTELEL